MSAPLFTLPYQAKRECMAALEWSEKHFGEEAALRYHQLLRTAFIEIGNDLEAPGSKFVDDFRLLHLQNSRKKTPVRGLILKLPRHFCLIVKGKGEWRSCANRLVSEFWFTTHFYMDFRYEFF